MYEIEIEVETGEDERCADGVLAADFEDHWQRHPQNESRMRQRKDIAPTDAELRSGVVFRKRLW